MKKFKKGIILAGGSGSRLYPLTFSISKQLLPIYDKPLIYYPLSVLMQAGIKDILLISAHRDIDSFKNLLGDGSNFGISIKYAIQDKPRGIADAFLIGEKFIGSYNVALILGDNFYYGPQFKKYLKSAMKRNNGATVFAYKVKDPERYGVVEFNLDGSVKSIQEKPKKPKTNYACTGLYFYDNNAISYAKSLKPSARGELEITDLNNIYLSKSNVFCEKLDSGFAWLDTGTFESLLEASLFVQTIQNRQAVKIACLEEISLKNEWLSREELKKSISRYKPNEYKKYLLNLINKK
tara:strand:+ start:21024 stop:21905 length:882 start_codon:yes stop_codon:yes gene_type:complete